MPVCSLAGEGVDGGCFITWKRREKEPLERGIIFEKSLRCFAFFLSLEQSDVGRKISQKFVFLPTLSYDKSSLLKSHFNGDFSPQSDALYRSILDFCLFWSSIVWMRSELVDCQEIIPRDLPGFQRRSWRWNVWGRLFDLVLYILFVCRFFCTSSRIPFACSFFYSARKRVYYTNWITIWRPSNILAFCFLLWDRRIFFLSSSRETFLEHVLHHSMPVVKHSCQRRISITKHKKKLNINLFLTKKKQTMIRQRKISVTFWLLASMVWRLFVSIKNKYLLLVKIFRLRKFQAPPSFWSINHPNINMPFDRSADVWKIRNPASCAAFWCFFKDTKIAIRKSQSLEAQSLESFKLFILHGKLRDCKHQFEIFCLHS